MYSEQRKAEIIQLIEQNGSINVNALAERFETSRETIRRDLSDLERQGVLKRTHGGAVLETQGAAASPPVEFPVGIRGIQRVEEKNRICRKAASFVREGDTLFVDNSSTLLYLPKYIPADMQITILTNSINFLLEVSKVSHYNWLLICLGGIFKSSNLSVHGAGTLKSAEEYYPSKTFFSCAGISRHNKVADSSLHEIEAKRMMIERAQETFLLADHTKFEKAGQMFLCELSAVNCIVTDPATEEGAADLSHLRQAGVNLVVSD